MSTSTLLHEVLSKDFQLYQKAHTYHWNVMGPQFQEYHAFFGALYTEVYAQIDLIAEQIRALGEKVDFSGEKVSVISSTQPSAIVDDLLTANKALVKSLNAAFKSAQKDNNQGLMNYLADRLDVHAKHNWMLSAMGGKESSLKESETIVEINGFQVIKEGELYVGLQNNDKQIRSENKHTTLSALVEELAK